MAYIVTLVILCAFYVIGIFCMQYMDRRRFWNRFFILAVYIPYVIAAGIIYADVGFFDWNFQNVLPVANVSPFMFSLMPILLFMPEKVKKHIFLLISLLSVGMLLSAVGGCLYNAAIRYRFHFHFLLDYIAHMLLSLFGVYLVISGQVELKTKNCLVSGSLILGVAGVMMLLNVVFDTAFFGLSLNGKHNIYNNVLVKNSWLSALIYFGGLSGVLFLGYLYSRCLREKQKLQ